MSEKISIFIVKRDLLRRLAACTWGVGSVALLWKAWTLLVEASLLAPEGSLHIVGALLGVALGGIKAVYLFDRSCAKNLSRIDELKHPYIWLFFRPGFFFFLGLMVTAGAMLSRLAQGNYAFLVSVAVVDLSIGVALLVSSRVFWNR